MKALVETILNITNPSDGVTYGAAVDVSAIGTISIMVSNSGMSVSGTFNLEASNDDTSPTNWASVPGTVNVSAASNGLSYAKAVDGQSVVIPLAFRWLRAKYTSQGSASGSVSAYLYGA